MAGDIVDKGSDSIRLAKLLFSMRGVIAVIGNHEHEFLNYYHNLMRTVSDYDYVMTKLQGYFSDGHLLDWDTVDRLDMLPYYEETDKFICVHAGMPVENGRLGQVRSDSLKNLVYDRRFKDPDVLPSGGKCVLFGHTPTWYLTGGKSEIIFYPRPGAPICSQNIADYCKIHLDMDTCHTKTLACLAIDNCECFYVTADR